MGDIIEFKSKDISRRKDDDTPTYYKLKCSCGNSHYEIVTKVSKEQSRAVICTFVCTNCNTGYLIPDCRIITTLTD